MVKCFKDSLSIAVLSVCLLGSSVLASVEFDGLTWYHSEDPSRLILNEQGHLVWVRPRGPDQVTVKLPEMDLSDVGDVAQVVYMYKTEGAKTGVASTDPTMLSGTGELVFMIQAAKAILMPTIPATEMRYGVAIWVTVPVSVRIYRWE